LLVTISFFVLAQVTTTYGNFTAKPGWLYLTARATADPLKG
jgi:hypothetical protein